MSSNSYSPNERSVIDIIKIYLDNISRTSENEELELEFKFGTKGNNITRIEQQNVIKKLLSSGFIMGTQTSLLRIFNEEQDETTGKIINSKIRTEINGMSNISEYCNKDTIKNDDGVIKSTFIDKSALKVNNNTIDTINFTDYNFRASLSKETTLNVDNKEVLNLLNDWNNRKKSFRYLTRYTLVNKDLPIKVDVSIVKSSKRIGQRLKSSYKFKDSGVLSSNEQYEIEIEVNNKEVGIGSNFNTATTLHKAVNNTIKLILGGLQNTNYPTTYTEQNSVLENYMEMLWGKEYRKKRRIYPNNFIGPSSYTLQMINIIPINDDIITPNIRRNYTVTDKADGDRKLLYVSSKGKLFLIDTNMKVQFTGSITNNKELFNTLIDGEHILNNKKNDYINLYAAFDIYYLNKKDIRSLSFTKLEDEDGRLSILVNTISNLKPIGIVKNAISPLRIENKTFYAESESQSIFNGCQTILNKIESGLFEYNTDGLIFTPMHLGVGSDKIGKTTKPQKMTWEYSFKWKPPEFNTIDFLMTLKKTPDGNDFIGNIFQDGINNNETNQIDQYKTAILRVGFDEEKHGYLNPCKNILEDDLPSVKYKDDNDNYKPLQFFPSNPSDIEAGVCNILLNKNPTGEQIMITEENEIIEDNMIVEFRYDLEREKNWRWVPLRVRYDKTADYRSGGKNYGNAYHVANSNWHMIHNPISKDMISTGLNIPNELGDDDVYYNKISGSTNTRALRDFHNLFVKNKLISSVSNKDDILIDLACGKAGDLPKWINANLKFVFGIDVSRDNIHNRLDGACARYLNYRKKFHKLPNVLFVNGNSGVNIRNTEALITEKDKQITKAVFGQGEKSIKELGKGVYKSYGVGENGFNICSIQFAIHYMFQTNTTLQNFIRNVSETTKVGGYFIGTSYDGDLIFNMLQQKKMGESVFVIENDKKIWEITKQYDHDSFDPDISSLGYAIDVYQESINKTFREYLVNYSYLTRLLENYGFKLLTNKESEELNLPTSTGLFSELFDVMKDETNRNKNYINNYGSAIKMTAGERKISFLNRYFVFKKIRNVDTTSVFLQNTDKSLEEEQLLNKVSNELQNNIESEYKKKPSRKLKRKLKLVMA